MVWLDLKYSLQWLCRATVVVLSALLCEQNLSANVQVANLKQDLELVAREVAGLRTEVELLRRENAQLKVNIGELSKRKSNDRSSEFQNLIIQMDAKIKAIDSKIAGNEKGVSALQKNFDEKIRELIKQMNLNFDKVTKSNVAATNPTFSADYPQNGFVHKVEKGETVSSIAKKYKSKITWIINANQIADPTKVFVGKELFVPQQ